MIEGIDALRPLSAGALLALWRACREVAEDPLERTVLCNARVLAACCFFGGEAAFPDEMAVLERLTPREMETLLRQLAEGGGPGREENPAFDPARFQELEE